MESPMNRPRAVEVIAEALRRHKELADAGVSGVSLEMHIYNVLVTKGFIKAPKKRKKKKIASSFKGESRFM